MAKKIFINLPVADLQKSMDFYSAIGFTNNPTFTDETAACMVLTEEIYVMLLTHPKFASIIKKEIINAKTTAGVINSLSVDTLAEVHTMVDAAIKAGGTEPQPMSDYGFMQQRAFEDPDGNLWDVIYMDMSKFPDNLLTLEINIMSNNSVTLHRVLTASPEKVFRAFADADAIASWLPPYGFVCKVHHMNFKLKGSFKMSFTNFTTSHSHSFGGEYVEIVPNELLRYTDKFDDPNLPGEMITTVRLCKVSCGTELNVVQEGIPSAIPAEMCYLGWQESLEKLKKLVEPEIPDA